MPPDLAPPESLPSDWPPSDQPPPDHPTPGTPPSLSDHGLQVHLSVHPITPSVHHPACSITAAECFSEFTSSPSQSASPNTIDSGLHVHLWVHSISVSKCIFKISRPWLPRISSRRYGKFTLIQGNGGGQSGMEYMLGRLWSRQTSSHVHIIISYNDNTLLIFPHIWCHSLWPRWCGFM